MKKFATLCGITALLFSSGIAAQTPATPDSGAAACIETPDQACLIEVALGLTKGYQNRNMRALVTGWLSAQLPDQAMFDAAMNDAKRIIDRRHRTTILYEIVSLHAEAGFRDNALAASGAMPETTDRLVAFSITALAIKDEQILNELSIYSRRYIGEDKSVRGVNSILDTLAKTGHTVAALSVAEAIEEDLFHAAALGKIGAASGDLDLVLRALHLAQSTETASSEFVRDLTLGRFPIFLLEAGDLQEALSLNASFEVNATRQGSLASSSVHLANNGRFDEAIEIANRIASIEFDTLNLSLSLDQERAFAEIIIALATSGQLDEALHRFESFEGTIWQGRVSAELAIALILANRQEEAVAIVSEIEAEPYLSIAQAEVAIGLAKTGAISEALAHAQTIGDSYLRARAIAEIALLLD